MIGVLSVLVAGVIGAAGATVPPACSIRPAALPFIEGASTQTVHFALEGTGCAALTAGAVRVQLPFSTSTSASIVGGAAGPVLKIVATNVSTVGMYSNIAVSGPFTGSFDSKVVAGPKRTKVTAAHEHYKVARLDGTPPSDGEALSGNGITNTATFDVGALAGATLTIPGVALTAIRGTQQRTVEFTSGVLAPGMKFTQSDDIVLFDAMPLADKVSAGTVLIDLTSSLRVVCRRQNVTNIVHLCQPHTSWWRPEVVLMHDAQQSYDQGTLEVGDCAVFACPLELPTDLKALSTTTQPVSLKFKRGDVESQPISLQVPIFDAATAASPATLINSMTPISNTSVTSSSSDIVSVTMTNEATNYRARLRDRGPYGTPKSVGFFSGIRFFASATIDPLVLRFPGTPADLDRSSRPASFAGVTQRAGLLLNLEPWDYELGRNLINWLPVRFQIGTSLLHYSLENASFDFVPTFTAGPALAIPLLAGDGVIPTALTLGLRAEWDPRGGPLMGWGGVLTASLSIGELFAAPAAKAVESN